MRDATLIYNPMAGVTNCREIVAVVADLWRRRGWRLDIYPTTHSGHATTLAREAVARKSQLVVVAGGDGTINEVVNGLVGSETILVPLPLGTANCLAKELNLTSFEPQQEQGLLAINEALFAGEVRLVDVGRCLMHRSQPRHWLLWASVGFDSYVVHQIEPRSRQFKRFGKLAYTAKTLSLLPGFSGMEGKVTVDGDSVRSEFLLINISNARWFAGELYLNPFGKLDDGIFEVWLIHGHDWPELIRSGIDIMRQIHPRQPQIQTLRGRHIEIETSRPQPAHLDGEPARTTPLTCEVIPKALHLLVPKGVPQGHFEEHSHAISLLT